MTKEVDFDEILEKARLCHKNKIKWHFHILTPACGFNIANNFVIIFENEKTREIISSTFKEKPLKQGEKLEELFYGRV